MKDTYQIWFDAGKMMAFKMPDLCEKEVCRYPSKFPDCECNDKLLSARAASLPVSDESKISVSKLILKSGITNIIPLDQTKEYSIEVQFAEECLEKSHNIIFKEEGIKCTCKKVLVLIEP